MPVTKRAYKQTSTTTLTAFDSGNYDTETIFNKVGVINLTDGDVSLYFGQQAVPEIIVPTNTSLAFDGFVLKGQCYVKNSTGTGGVVYLHVWRHDVPGQ